MTVAADNIISTAMQVLASDSGFVADVKMADVDTGEISSRLVALTPNGRLNQTLLANQDPTDFMNSNAFRSAIYAPYYSSLRLAALAVPEVRHDLTGISADIENALNLDVQTVACDDSVLFLLINNHRLGGVEQRLFRVFLQSTEDSGLSEIELSAIELDQGRSVTGLALLDGMLDLMVADPIAGFGIYRLDAYDDAPVCKPVLLRGAQRYSLNSMVSAVTFSRYGLLLGTAALANGALPHGNWGPELLSLLPDDSWDILIGQPRITADETKLSVSGLLPGLGNPENAAIRAIAIGSFGQALNTVIAVQTFSGKPVERREDAHPDILDYMGVTRFYRTSDFMDWHPIPIELPRTAGAVTCMALSEAGLLVGHEALGSTAAPFTLFTLQP